MTIFLYVLCSYKLSSMTCQVKLQGAVTKVKSLCLLSFGEVQSQLSPSFAARLLFFTTAAVKLPVFKGTCCWKRVMGARQVKTAQILLFFLRQIWIPWLTLLDVCKPLVNFLNSKEIDLDIFCQWSCCLEQQIFRSPYSTILNVLFSH